MTSCGCNTTSGCCANQASLSNLGPELTWEIKQGASFTFEGELRVEGDTHTIEDEDGNEIKVGPPLDITGCTIRCQIRKRGLDTGTPVVSCTCTVVDGPNGLYEIAATGEQTATIPSGERLSDRASLYTADILCEFPSGEVMELGHVNIYTLRRVTKS
jgi:hypothetical protein